MEKARNSKTSAGIGFQAPKPAIRYRFPDIDDLATRIRFVPGNGEIWLENRRMILLHNASLGALRQELIETLGSEKARGIITRMGYHAGARDADMVRRIRSDSTDFDAFAVGPQLHALEGFISIETITMDVDVEAGHFYGEFLWHNSAEAERHVAAFGIGNAPVCWMQQGYANGYLSTFLGRQMLVREVECKGMGHAACKIIGKPLAQWDDPDKDFRYLQAQEFVHSPAGKLFSLGTPPRAASPATTSSWSASRRASTPSAT